MGLIYSRYLQSICSWDGHWMNYGLFLVQKPCNNPEKNPSIRWIVLYKPSIFECRLKAILAAAGIESSPRGRQPRCHGCRRPGGWRLRQGVTLGRGHGLPQDITMGPRGFCRNHCPKMVGLYRFMAVGWIPHDYHEEKDGCFLPHSNHKDRDVMKKKLQTATFKS